MRRPSTSSCTSPTMGGVQTMPCWRQQGAPQEDPIIWMRMRSETESSEFVGFILNDPMTAHTTTSDLPPSTLQPASLTPDSLCTTLVPYNTQRLSVSLPLLFDQLSPGDYECHTTVCSGEVILCVFRCPLVTSVLWSDRL